MKPTPTNKPKFTATTPTSEHRSPRKQAKPRRSLAGPPEKQRENIKILETSSDEEEPEPENKQNNKNEKEENNQTT